MDVPEITSRMGTTKILMPSPTIFTRSPPVSTSKQNETTHEDGSNSYGVVYVNSLARELVKADPPIPFPTGSIIVREKLAKAGDTQPLLLTVMIRRARGFNPNANDWEFLAVNGAMNKILERQKKGACVDCHASQQQRDFVYLLPLN